MSRSLHVVGIGGGLTGQHAVFFTPGQAATLAGRGQGRVDGMGLFLEAGADPEQVGAAVEQRIREALAADVPSPSGVPSFRVAWGTERGELEGTMGDHRASAQAMTMLIWIVAFMATAVIGGALITSVRRRATQFSLLRAVGATPRQVRLLCHAEALLVAAAGILLGTLLGVALARVLVRAFQALGLLTSVLTVRVGPGAVALAVVTVLAVTQAAAWFSARAALRLRPGDAMAGAAEAPAHGRRGWLRNAAGIGVLCAAGGLQVAGMSGLLPNALSASYGMIASGLIIVAIGLLGASAIHLVATLLRRPVAAAAPVGGYLAAANVRFHHRRYAGVAAPLAVGVAIAGWALSGLPLFALSNAERDAARFSADHVVRTQIIRDEPTGLSEESRRAVAGVPGVTDTVGLRETWLQATPSQQEPDPKAVTRGTVVSGAASRLLDLGPTDGDLGRIDAGEGIALGRSYAERRGISLGDRVHVRLSGASSPATLEVVALFDREQGGQEAAVVPQAALGDHAGAQWFAYVLVGGTPAPDDLRDALSPAGVSAENHARFLDTYVEERRAAIDNLGTLAAALVGLFLVVAAVTALALSAADRADELSALRRLNALPRQVTAMACWEMVLTVFPAWLLGMAATAVMAFAMARGNLGATWWAFPWAALSLVGLFAVALAVGGALAATKAAQR